MHGIHVYHTIRAISQVCVHSGGCSVADLGRAPNQSMTKRFLFGLGVCMAVMSTTQSAGQHICAHSGESSVAAPGKGPPFALPSHNSCCRQFRYRTSRFVTPSILGFHVCCFFWLAASIIRVVEGSAEGSHCSCQSSGRSCKFRSTYTQRSSVRKQDRD